MIDDGWPSPAADGVGGPFMKMKRRLPHMACAAEINATNMCYETYGWLGAAEGGGGKGPGGRTAKVGPQGALFYSVAGQRQAPAALSLRHIEW